MEFKMLNEINRLKNQIEQYQQKVNLLDTEKISCPNKSFNFEKSKVYPNIKNPVNNSVSNTKILPHKSTNNVYVKSQLCTTNVHVNPNFKPQNATVHINPNIHTKSLIHINPKIMNNIANSNQNLQNNTSMTNLSTTKTLIDNNTIHKNVKRSIYVNPTLMKKLSSSSEGKLISNKESIIKEQSICSRLKCAKSIDYRKKTNNSSIVLLSQRKLVRITRTIKNTSKISPLSQYRLSKSAELIQKRSKTISPKTVKVKPLLNNTLQSVNTNSNLLKLNINKSPNKSKVTKYKIDRTTLYVPKSKRVDRSQTKIINNIAQFVTIGGIVYKASKNKLIRRSSSLKRKRLIGGKNDKLNVAVNEKKQRNNKETLNRKLETNITNKTRFISNISPKATYKNSISNKAKQRSIRILRNKMHKNNQPCLIFQRFGSCPNIKNGVCPKRHDKKQVSLCKRFLQGKCFLDKCLLSHDVGPEKMPTCKYFLDGCCTRDACPYLHVKVSSNTSICIDFLQGYCAMGNKCQRRHENLCPEFHKSGICSKGECCPYPHKSHSTPEKNAKYLNKTRDVQKHKATFATKDDSSNPESRLRYYEITDDLSEDLEKKKETLTVDSTKQIKINKINEVNKSMVNEDTEITTSHYGIKRKKISISYIPIDSFL
ncbi:zinc finger CCCH domain-containing protein 3 [Linepithema humile]|uniref:zinc finger CCCH domain-containing protein 3 n=1 Tax=Linepithema humile TaxID=83485 RepID=UPI0006238DAB|nr:PREDICTED: uncharacterized protein LOC105673045 [Linepithema humile]